ncbi:MAG: tRNA (adenosine(37)-N6)-threonylcarbamoyltransferase complex ATPase subunit type 1 TsaE [Deltaproteobacteria bacterium]|nr:tRNA (adenosine(37)-N6)-threonylcarbamoyltransferase complex ATPase subunit type 1 TsaE [Deltaproteobacteria bacterium]
MSRISIDLRSDSEGETIDIARALGAVLVPGDVVALEGELGAGKTVFCKGVGESLGVSPERIVSPTFTIVTEHEGALPLYHVDLYRLSSEWEAACIGLEEILNGEGVCLVEWPEVIVSLLPKHCIKVRFLFLEPDGRSLNITAEDTPRMRGFLFRCKPYLPGG